MKKRISILSILLLLGMTVYAQTDIPQVNSLLTTLEWGKRQTDTTGNRKDYNRSGSRKPVERKLRK